MHDLAAEWINNFVEYLATSEPEEAPEDWMMLSDYIVQRGAAYWKNTEQTPPNAIPFSVAWYPCYGESKRRLAVWINHCPI